MKRILLFCCCYLVLLVGASAQISQEEAVSRAGEFLNARRHQSGRRGVSQKLRNLRAEKVNDGLYAVNASGGGFVLVANSEATEPVLAYGYDGTFDLGNMPDNVKAWVTNVGRLVQQANAGGARKISKQKAPVSVKSPISPLTTSEWNQGSIKTAAGEAYNWNCPNYNYSNGETRHCLTGCVATAMAQVMYYHKWPQGATTVVPSYTSNSTIGTLDELPAITFDWDAMQDEYIGTDLTDVNSAAAQAVGTLMRYCGQGAKMNYGTGGSSASSPDALTAFINYFHYNPNAYLADRSDYTNTEWENLIYSELAADRPVLYSGQSTGGGHSFICDGYDGDGLYHINWGWGGTYNGYFSLSVLNSESNDGAGASSTEDGYSFMQDALIGLQREATEPISGTDGLTVSNVADDGSTLSMEMSNETTATLGTIYYSFGVVDSEGNVSRIFGITNASGLPSGYYYSPSISYRQLASGLSDGTYTVTGVQSTTASNDLDQWGPANGYKRNYAVVTIENGAVASVEVYPKECDLSVTGATFTGTGYTGTFQEVKATFQNNTDEEYNGMVVMVADYPNDLANYGYESVASNLESTIAGVYTYANGPGTAYFYFTPTSDGEHTLYFWEISGDVCSRLLGTATVTSTTSSDAGQFTASLDVENLIETDGVNYLVSDVFTADVTLTNTTTASVGGSFYYIMKGDKSANGFKTTIGAGSSYSRTVMRGDLTPGETYTFILTNGNPFGDNPDILASVTFTVSEGLLCYDADEAVSFVPKSSEMVIPQYTCAVDFSHCSVSSSTSVVPSTNPNCIYYFDDWQTVPSSLSGQNVVKGTSADVINLYQNYPFYILWDFVSDAVSYTASFEGSKEDSKDGWSTLVLPFEATQVSCEGEPVDWFKSASDAGKNFWLYQFLYEEGGKAHFDYVAGTELKANIPYLIAVPDESYGDNWNLDGKELVFSGDITEFSTDAKCSITGQQLSMKGTYKPAVITNGYVLNADGNAFVRVSSDGEVVDPFSAYFENKGNVIRGASVVSIVIGDGGGQATGIRTPLARTSVDGGSMDTGWYNLQGQRVSRPGRGVYIHGGKKVLIK